MSDFKECVRAICEDVIIKDATAKKVVVLTSVCVVTSVALHDYNLSWYVEQNGMLFLYLSYDITTSQEICGRNNFL